MSIYYTYVSYETDKSLFEALSYVGYRKLKDAPTPEEEDYFGSPKSIKNLAFKNNPNKAKVILGKFDNKKDAIAHEIYLHKLWDVDNNPKFANMAKQRSNGFYFSASGFNNPRANPIKRDWFNVETNSLEINITNLELRQKYSTLSHSGLSSVVSGKYFHTKKWMILPNDDSLSLEQRIEITKKLYKEYENKRKECRKKARSEKTKRTWFNFKTGYVETTITNFELREKYPGLNPQDVVSGKYFHTKGWMLLPNDDGLSLEQRIEVAKKLYKKHENNNPHVKKEIRYTWENVVDGSIEISKAYEFKEKHPELNADCINRLIRGGFKKGIYKNWKVLSCFL